MYQQSSSPQHPDFKGRVQGLQYFPLTLIGIRLADLVLDINPIIDGGSILLIFITSDIALCASEKAGKVIDLTSPFTATYWISEMRSTPICISSLVVDMMIADELDDGISLRPHVLQPGLGSYPGYPGFPGFGFGFN